MARNEPRNCVQPALWAVAYKRYFRLWVKLALTVYSDTEEAEDVVHAVIQSAMTREGGTFDSLEHIRNYVAKAVLNRAGQTKRRDERLVRWDETADLLTGVQPSSEELEEEERDQMLRSVLAKLSFRDWEIVKLRYFNALTLQQIAEHLRLPLSTVKSREESALRRIRDRLRGNGMGKESRGRRDGRP